MRLPRLASSEVDVWSVQLECSSAYVAVLRHTLSMNRRGAFATSGVSITPGVTTLTRTPAPAYSTALAFYDGYRVVAVVPCRYNAG